MNFKRKLQKWVMIITLFSGLYHGCENPFLSIHHCLYFFFCKNKMELLFGSMPKLFFLITQTEIITEHNFILLRVCIFCSLINITMINSVLSECAWHELYYMEIWIKIGVAFIFFSLHFYNLINDETFLYTRDCYFV